MSTFVAVAVLTTASLMLVACHETREQGLFGDLPDEARPGARLFAEAGCTTCHTYRGVGARNYVAPAWRTYGRREPSIGVIVRFVEIPSRVGPDSQVAK